MHPSPARERLQRRAEYTHQFNTTAGRHGWLRLTPAYSVKIVEALTADCGGAQRILDPFCGTGTTALCAAYGGHPSVTTDVNPFLVWLARAKCAHYTRAGMAATLEACARIAELVARREVDPAPAPPMFNIERWWRAPTLDFLRLLRAAIDVAAPPDTEAGVLLRIAFCRTLIEQSAAAFNHQSMSFRDAAGDASPSLLPFPENRWAAFEANVRLTLRGALENPQAPASIMLADARHLSRTLEGSFDLVITSPPYANRMSYIRELRPYMYWLGFLENGRDAGELDWRAIGGTWGVATSRLAGWERPEHHFKSPRLKNALATMAQADAKSGVLLTRYVAKYFDDMWAHFCELPALLSPGAEVHYIVGNSTFYGTLIPTERLYAEMLAALGFSKVECRPLRKRNSKKELIEFDVAARWR